MTLPLSKEQHRDLVVRFLAELLQMTRTPNDQDAFQRSLQGVINGLQPWLEPNDCPPNPCPAFSLLEDCTFDETGENVTVVLSTEFEAFLCA
jgi:hypothetical protein